MRKTFLTKQYVNRKLWGDRARSHFHKLVRSRGCQICFHFCSTMTQFDAENHGSHEWLQIKNTWQNWVSFFTLNKQQKKLIKTFGFLYCVSCYFHFYVYYPFFTKCLFYGNVHSCKNLSNFHIVSHWQQCGEDMGHWPLREPMPKNEDKSYFLGQ